MADILGSIKSSISAVDKGVSAMQNGNDGNALAAAKDAFLSLNSVASLLISNPYLKGLGALGSLASLKSAMDDAYNANSAAEALKAMAGALAAVGSLMTLFPTPQTKIVGAAMAIGFTAVKRGIEAYIDSENRQAIESVPKLPPYIFDPLFDVDYGRNLLDIPGISNRCNTNFRTAVTPPRRDPLAIDLDGDGIETVGIPTTGSPILFDHDGDGVKTGTGWLKGDDAWLVLDRDGNGTIDTGAELFGVDTMITVTVQKRREIGIISALGSRIGQIMWVFLTQGMIVGALGSLSGLFVGWLVVVYRNVIRHKIADWTGHEIFDSTIYGLIEIPAKMLPWDLGLICLGAFFLCTIASLLPAFLAAHNGSICRPASRYACREPLAWTPGASRSRSRESSRSTRTIPCGRCRATRRARCCTT